MDEGFLSMDEDGQLRDPMMDKQIHQDFFNGKSKSNLCHFIFDVLWLFVTEPSCFSFVHSAFKDDFDDTDLK